MGQEKQKVVLLSRNVTAPVASTVDPMVKDQGDVKKPRKRMEIKKYTVSRTCSLKRSHGMWIYLAA